jgi:RES domain-containing protein
VRGGLKERILSTQGNRFYPGRFHLKGETGVLYSSLNERTALAEVRRHVDPASLSEGLVTGKIRVKLKKVLDFTQEEALTRLGMKRENLTSPDLTLPQAISHMARQLGIQGLIVPSATGEGKNLVIFEDNMAEGCALEVVETRVTMFPESV